MKFSQKVLHKIEDIDFRVEDWDGDEWGNLFFTIQAYIDDVKLGKGLASCNTTGCTEATRKECLTNLQKSGLVQEAYKILAVNDICGGYTIIEGVNTRRTKLVKVGQSPSDAAKFLGGECIAFEHV